MASRRSRRKASADQDHDHDQDQQAPSESAVDEFLRLHADARTAIITTLAEGVVHGPGNVSNLCRHALLAFGRKVAAPVRDIASCGFFSAPHRDELLRVAAETSGREMSLSVPHALLTAFMAAIDCPNDRLSGMAGEALGKMSPQATDILVTEALRRRYDPIQMLRFLRAAERTGRQPESVELKLQLFSLSIPRYPEIRQIAQRLACVHPMPEWIDTSLIDPFTGFGLGSAPQPDRRYGRR